MSRNDYSQCWANCLGDCSEGMSQEHLVSECLFEGEINVMGLPWCKDEPRKMRIERLTDDILCSRHNKGLSEVDSAAKHSLDTIAEAVDLFDRRSQYLSRSWTIKRFQTDLWLLERWCLKTLMNVRMNSQPDYEIACDWDELVRVAFGLEMFTPPKGLYMMAMKGHNIPIGGKKFNITTQSLDGTLAGAKFQLWGMPFFLNITPEPLQLNQGKGHMIRGGMKQWFTTKDDKGRDVPSHQLAFTYSKH